jgi:Nuclease-related domain
VQLKYWILAGAAAAIVLAIVIGTVVWRRRRVDVRSVLDDVAVESLHDVLVPDGMGGHIHIEHLVLTAHGILVVDIKRFEGAVFGSDRMDEWTVIGKQGRFSFPNPQGTLYDRVAAVKQLVREIRVTGHVLFPDSADFSKGRPRDVILARELADRYRKPDRGATEQVGVAFAPHWDRICEAVEVMPGRR